MKVQTKISLLLLVVVAIFLGGLASIRNYEKIKFRRIAEERFSERNRSFETFLESYGAPLKTLTEDFTCLDQLVQAIASADNTWLSQNINDSTLASYHANAVWVFRQDGTLLYPHNNLNAASALTLPAASAAFAQLFAHDALRHFYVWIPQGLMEIRAGTVHPSKDFQRQSPAYGYFFAGRLWSKPAPGETGVHSVIGEMSMFTNNKIRLVPAGERANDIVDRAENGLIMFSRSLPGWDGAPVARLVIQTIHRS